MDERDRAAIKALAVSLCNKHGYKVIKHSAKKAETPLEMWLMLETARLFCLNTESVPPGDYRLLIDMQIIAAKAMQE